MKRFLSKILIAILGITLFAACEKDDSDFGKEVSGTYTGQLKYGTEIREDAYVVTVSRVSNDVVSMSAKFLDGSKNFNVEKVTNGYNLYSETVYNFNCTVNKKTITVNYKSNGGQMLTFQGTKD